jgi:hypothetical protein
VVDHSDEFFDISGLHMGAWAFSAEKQLERVRDNPDGGELRFVDLVFLIISLRNCELSLMRHRDEVWATVGRGKGSVHRRRAAKWADKAVQVFKEQLPDLRDMRNIFSHLDAYAYGEGWKNASKSPLSILSEGANVFTIKNDEEDFFFQLNLDEVGTALEDIKACLIELFTWWTPPE